LNIPEQLTPPLMAAARRAPHLANPIAPTEENLMAGVKLFKGDCAGCHGDPNNATKRETENFLYPSPPVFALHPRRKPNYRIQRQMRESLFGARWRRARVRRQTPHPRRRKRSRRKRQNPHHESQEKVAHGTSCALGR